ncbi:MAG TPA: TadE family protein [Terriglobales bacterium]
MGRWRALWRGVRRAPGEQGGAELVEFAICLPILVVFVVGTYDFGAAFTLKQKLNSAAAAGARVAAGQTTSDLSTAGGCGAAPISVCAVRDVVDSALARSGVNDCNLIGSSGTLTGVLKWEFDGSCGTGTLHLTIERGFSYTATLAAPFDTSIYRIEASRITLTYPYQWQFGRAITLIAPTANYTGSQITVTAAMQNLN